VRDEGRGDDGEQNKAASFPTLGERRYSRTLEGGLAILGCFTPQRPVLGTTEIAEALGMSVATAHRLIRTLADEGYLEQAESSRSYRLTLRATELGMASVNETGLCRHARPHLEELARHVGHTVALGVLDGPDVLLIDLAGSARGLRCPASEALHAGSLLPAHCTAIGKTLLAGLPRRRGLKLISEMELSKRGPRTITSKAALREVLEDVRREGLAINDEELDAGTCAVAAPVRDRSGDVVAAVSVLAHHGRIELQELLGQSASRLLASTWRVSTSLGWVEAGE
jgi:IclR family transcriptional regulator, pca regulon regulatory protein